MDSDAITLPGDASPSFSATYTNGRVATVTKAGIVTNYSWSLVGSTMTATITRPDGGQRIVTTDTSKNVILTDRDALNRTTRYKYDSYGRLTHVVSPEGAVDGGGNPVSGYTRYTYDARGNVTEVRQVSKTPGTPADLVTLAGYDTSCTYVAKCNKPNWTRDAKGAQTDYLYDNTTGNLLSVTAPAPSGTARPVTVYGYANRQAYYKNGAGSIVASGQDISLPAQISTCQTAGVTTPTTALPCSGGGDEVRTIIDYGPQIAGIANNLLPVSVTQRNGTGTLSVTTATAYDAIGNVLTVDGPLAGTADTTRYRYDAARQLVGIVGPDPDGVGSRVSGAQRISYNGRGQVTATEVGTVADQSDAAWSAFSPAQSSVTVYDATSLKPVRNELRAGGITGPIQAVTQQSYDTGGRPLCTAVRMNLASLPADACTLGAAGADGWDRITRAGYDVVGRVTSVTEAYGVIGEQAVVQTNSFTANGKQASVKDGENNLTTYEYDGHDRLVKARFPNPTKGSGTSSTSDYEQLTYDPNGNVTARRLRDGNTLGMGYDALNRLVTLGGTSISDRTFGYDLLGRMTSSVLTTSGMTLTNSYDALGRLTSAAQPYGTLVYQYDAAGRRTQLKWTSDNLSADYAYDVTGQLLTIKENGATMLASYSYDNLGRRTGVSYGNGTARSYEYDAVSRVTGLGIDLAGTAQDLVIGKIGSTGTAIGYNGASQIKALARSNDAYAWSGHENVTRGYTANGLNQYSQMASTPTTGSPVTTNYSYDARGNLTSAGGVSYGYDGLNQLTSAPGGAFTYDPAGRLVQQVAGATMTRFVYDGGMILGELNGSGGILRRYVPGPGTDEPVVWYEGSGTTDRRYLQGDERGSIVAVTNGAGATLSINSYDEYGTPDALNLGRFGYTGQAWLPETGLYYYKARIYSPSLGRFLQTDPTGYDDGLNWYNYAGGDPVNGSDPMGLSRLTTTFSNCYGNCGSGGDYSSIPRENWSGIPSGTRETEASIDFDDRKTMYITGHYVFSSSSYAFVYSLFNVGGGQSLFPGSQGTPQNGKPHKYEIKLLSPCPAKDVFGYFKGAGRSAPGAPAAREGFTPRVGLGGGNPISQYVNSSTRTIVNTTLPGHWFYPGTVTIQVNALSDQTSTITITGVGTGANPWINDAIGQAWFGGTANGAADVCGRW